MSILKYHQKSLELTGSQPEFNSEKYPNLPASVSEWFSLSNGRDILEKYSNQDLPLHPSKFQVCKFEDKNLLVFMYENQRVVCWAFENSNKEDPPVYIIYDPSNDDFPVEFISKDCYLLEEHFSEFVYKWLFDNFHMLYTRDLFFIKGTKPLDKNILDILHKDFKKEPITLGNDGEVYAYRFSNNDQKIVIFNLQDESVWELSASTKEAFDNLYEKFSYLF